MDFDMGKYALYVWGSYGATALATGGLVVLSLRAHAAWRKQLENLQAVAEKK